jgi:MoxR-like ATPase
MRIEMGYPDRAAEKRLLLGEGSEIMLDRMDSCLMAESVADIQEQVQRVHASDSFLEYLQDILIFTRVCEHFQVGLSPRAGLALLRAARSWAFFQGRDYVLPEDLQKVLPWVAGHRLKSRDHRSELDRDRLMEVLMKVPIP